MFAEPRQQINEKKRRRIGRKISAVIVKDATLFLAMTASNFFILPYPT
jgi:hypothetical protein